MPKYCPISEHSWEWAVRLSRGQKFYLPVFQDAKEGHMHTCSAFCAIAACIWNDIRNAPLVEGKLASPMHLVLAWVSTKLLHLEGIIQLWNLNWHPTQLSVAAVGGLSSPQSSYLSDPQVASSLYCGRWTAGTWSPSPCVTYLEILEGRRKSNPFLWC